MLPYFMLAVSALETLFRDTLFLETLFRTPDFFTGWEVKKIKEHENGIKGLVTVLLECVHRRHLKNLIDITVA